MGTLSLYHWIIVFVVTLVLFGSVGVVARSRAGYVVLVLRRFELSCQAQAAETPLIEIVGRRPGVLAFLLALIGLEAQTTFIVTQLCVECQIGSLFGNIKRIVPLSRVASTTAGVRKPIGYLIVAGILIVAGPVVAVAARAMEVLAVCLVLAIVFAIAYFLSKAIVLEVSSNAGLEISLRFKPSILEGVPVDVSKAMAAAEAIRDLLLGRQVTVGQTPARLQSSAWPPVDGQPHPPFSATSSPPSVPTQPMRSAVAVQATPVASSDEAAARNALRDAVRLYKAGQTAAGIEAMRDVVSRFRGTQAADTAHGHLKNLMK